MTGPPARRRAVRSLPAVAARVGRRWGPQLMALAGAAAVITATVVGSLGVGDSLRQGLRRLASDRLGGIAAAVIAREPFRADLAERSLQDARRRFAEATGQPADSLELVPAFSLEITVERPADGRRPRAAAIARLLACDRPERLGYAEPVPDVAAGEVALSESLAATLGLTVGDPVILRVAERSAVPADTPLGRRQARSRSRRLTLARTLPRGSLGDFALRPTHAATGVAQLSLATAQQLLNQPDRAGLLLVATRGGADAAASAQSLRLAIRPTLDDYGLAVEAVGAPAVIRLTSRRLLLERVIDRAAADVLEPRGGFPSLVFLANEIRPVADTNAVAGEPRRRPASVPYSTVLGIESPDHPLGGLVDAGGDPLPKPVGDEVIIDQWLADDLAAQGSPVTVGDALDLTCFLPETLHGQVLEQTHRCTICGIAAMQGLAARPDSVPTVVGVTDEDSIADWDPPFPFDRQRIRATPPADQDDQYWKAYRATPKLFMPLARARQIAGSRFGETTAWHLRQAAEQQVAEVAAALAAALPPAAAGIDVLPLATVAATAATGSTPFGLLFLALSSFVIAAGLILLWLLFGLLIASRSRTLGILAAVGWAPGRLAALLAVITSVVILVGVAAGVLAGPAWSRLLLVRLGRGWTAAVSSGSDAVFQGGLPGLKTLAAGALVAGCVAITAVMAAALRAGRRPPLGLLRGTAAGTGSRRLRARRPVRSLAGLAGRGVAWRAGRGLAVVAMVGLAEFLIVFVAGFELTQPGDSRRRDSPTGGWTHLAEFAAATSVDPSRSAAAAELGLSSDQQRLLAGCEIALLRSSRGDDASCTNLYATNQPLVLGLPAGFCERGGFRFVSHLPLAAGETNPWRLLGRPEEGRPTPVILDAATAQWALKLGGLGSVFWLSSETGGVTTVEPPGTAAAEPCQIVGLLEPGILQGAVLMAEADFERLHPLVSGYRRALVAAPSAAADGDDLTAALAAAWVDAAATVELTAERLRRLYAVQNTFLAGFQTLGTLGLLLGTAGVAAVAFQGAIERRGSLAVLQAIGFRRRRLAAVLWLESLLPVAVGLAAGAGAGLLAAAPLLATSRRGLPWGMLGGTVLGTLLVASLAGLLAVWLMAIPRRPAEE